jgi:hypothetical protein
VQQVAGDHVDELHRAAAADVGALLDQRRAQHALHRTHQPAVVTVDIGSDGGAAEVALGFVGAVEHRRRHGGLSVFQLDQRHAVGAGGQRDGGIGSAEVDGGEAGCGHGGSVWAAVVARPQQAGRGF